MNNAWNQIKWSSKDYQEFVDSMPNFSGEYLFTMKDAITGDKSVVVDTLKVEAQCFRTSHIPVENYIAWMELPKPYRGE